MFKSECQYLRTS